MHEDAHVMMPGGVQSQKFAVERVREPGQRMPVRLLVCGESPLHSRPGQAGPYVRVVDDIGVVIIAEKAVTSYRVVASQHGNGQQQTQQQSARVGRSKEPGGRWRFPFIRAFRYRGGARQTHEYDYSERDRKDSRERTEGYEFRWSRGYGGECFPDSTMTALTGVHRFNQSSCGLQGRLADSAPPIVATRPGWLFREWRSSQRQFPRRRSCDRRDCGTCGRRFLRLSDRRLDAHPAERPPSLCGRYRCWCRRQTIRNGCRRANRFLSCLESILR